jgi:hypothetical protein
MAEHKSEEKGKADEIEDGIHATGKNGLRKVARLVGTGFTGRSRGNRGHQDRERMESGGLSNDKETVR